MPTFSDILIAFEWTSSGHPGENTAVLCRSTGKVYWQSASLDMEEEELPDDIDDLTKYIEIPDKRELDLGQELVLSFASEFLADDYDEIRSMFRRRGAYQRFKALLAERRALDRWYDFENKATERALREWCDVNSITLTD